MRLALATLLLAASSGIAAAAQTADAAQDSAFLRPDPGFSELGYLREPLDAASLARAALLASGTASDRIPSYESRLAQILRRATAAANAAVAAKPEAILTFLHKEVLRAYSEDSNGLDGILDSGLFNCVSSAVLYAIAARSQGFEVEGVKTSDHAFCSVRVGGRSVDVETTNPFGFDPGDKKEFKDSFGRATGFAYVAPGGYGDRKAIGLRELAGLILSNRSSLLERAGRYPEAARLGADYAALCPGPDSRAFQVDRINNLVAAFEARRDFAGAEGAARAASAALPGEPRLAALARTAAYNRAVNLGQSGDWEAAFEASAQAASVSPGDRAAAALVSSSLQGLAQAYARRGEFEAARRAVSERSGRAGPEATAAALALVGEIELVRAANDLPFAAAAAVADRVLAAGEVSAARYAQALAAIYGNEAGRIGSGGDWLRGAALADQGAAKVGKSSAGGGSLAALAQSLRRNFVAEAHNRFARLYNSGDFAGAKAALTAALSAMPGDPTLARDLASAEAALVK